MNIFNVILLVVGIFNLLMGIAWTKKNTINLVLKIMLLFGGVYLSFYAFYLSGILLIISSR